MKGPGGAIPAPVHEGMADTLRAVKDASPAAVDDAQPELTPAPVPAAPDDPPIDPATPLFRIRSFALLFTTRLSSNMANHMLAVAAGWQVYELTDSALHLGLIGLVQFMPPLLLMLLAGQVADRFNRRLIIRCCFAVELGMYAGMFVVSLMPRPSLVAIYLLLLGNAMARTFEQPTILALVPAMAPRALLGRAVAAHVAAGKLSVLLGPSLGGIIYIFGPDAVYGTCTLLVLAASVASFLMPAPPTPATPPKVSWATLVGGFTFIWRCQPVLGAMLFDLVATLFGGVTALLPIYARDILDIGPWGAGVLRSAPAFGALLTAAVLTRIPIRRGAGNLMFAGFALYGLAVIVFGLSTNVALSVISLILIGTGDMLSSVIRNTLVQVTTPDEMRGRAAAVNSFFIGCSGQLGSFRAGLMAAWIGAIGSVVVGGVAVFATVALWVWLFPSLRDVERPDQAQAY
jgi:MFS family permease